MLARQDARFKGKVDGTSSVETHSFKSVQGRENIISIMDLTVCRDIGFMNQRSQSLVGCSRGSDALYVIGDVARLKLMPNYEHKALGQLVEYCEQHGFVRKWRDAKLEMPN